MQSLSWILLALPLISAAVIHFILPKRHDTAAILATASALVTMILAFILMWSKASPPSFSWASVSGLDLRIGLQHDTLAKGMMIVVTVVGFLVHLFSLEYMKSDDSKARYFCGLSLFMFSMTGIVLSTNFIMTFIFWELVGLSSYLLIGHWYQKISAADAAKKAFLVNRIGDFGFMIGILMLWKIAGSLEFDGLNAWANTHPAATPILGAAVLLVFCGAMGKSAQAPLHVWLPDAMEGPTPVSALIHAATMVAAGVYMMARLFTSLGIGHGEEALIHLPAFAPMTIAWIGGITSLLAALMATQQDDIKKILAYSTLSQLGYMIMAIGLLNKEAAMFHLFTHAWFKALLFLGSGALIFACHHQQNIWKMGGLRKKMPITFITFGIGTLALCGFPFITAGFWSKEQILESALHAGNTPLFLIAALVACLTTFYMFRLFFIVFFGKHQSDDADHAREVGPLMWVPLAVLAVLALIAGFPFFAKSVAPLYHHHGFDIASPAFIASILAFLIGLGAAYLLYFGKEKDPLAEKSVFKIFRHKFYFDEAYAKLVAFGQDFVAAIVHFIDELIINGLIVGGLSRGAAGLGGFFGRLQSGNLQSYAAIFGIGVILIIFFTVFL